MKAKRWKWLTATLATAALSLTVAGAAIGAPVTASAADSESSKYWHFTKGSGTVTSAAGESSVTHTVNTTKGSDVTIAFNGEVSPVWPLSGDPGKMLFVQNTKEGAESPAEAIVYTYTATTDYDLQLSFIFTSRGGSLYATAAFTDDITIIDGYAYVDGGKTATEKNTDGEKHSSDWICAILGTDGQLYAGNGANPRVDIDNEAFFSNSLAELPEDSEYRSRYTAEYAANLIAALKTGAVMEVSYYNVSSKAPVLDIRGMTGASDKGATFKWAPTSYSNGDNNFRGYWWVDKEDRTLYAGKAYNVKDLFKAYNFGNPTGDMTKENTSSNGQSGYVRGTDPADTATWWGSTNWKSFTPTTEMIGQNYYVSFGGNMDNSGYPNNHNHKFKVVDSTPVVTAKSVTFTVGETYTLADLFEYTAPLGGETVVYTVNGEAATTWTADCAGATIVCTVTDKNNQVASATMTAPEAHTWTAATCTAPKTCSTCEKTEGEALGHTSEVLPAVAATCSATGLTEGSKCSVCNEVLVAQTATEKVAHTPEVVPAVAATCSATGLTEGSKCSVCNEVLTAQETTEKIAHTPEVVPAVAATCTATGLTEGKKCSVCGEVLVAQEVIPVLTPDSSTPETSTPDNSTTDSDSSAGGSGCFGSIGTLSGVFAILAVAGVAVAIKRKKEN